MAVLHIVKVKNLGEETFDIPHKGEVATLDPGKEVVVTWEAACSAFGDPALRNTPSHAARAERYELLRAQWNFYKGFDVEDEKTRAKHPHGEDRSSWELKKPRVEIRTVDTDETIYMLIDDPKGEKVNPEVVSGFTGLDVTNQAQTTAQIEELKDQVARLTSVLAVLDPTLVSGVVSQPAPVVTVTTAAPEADVVIPAPVEIPATDGPAPKRGK